MAEIDPADIDEARASAKWGPGFACLLRAISYGDDLDKITSGIGKATTDGPWLVAFQTPKGSCTLPADVARGWADKVDTPEARALGGFEEFIGVLRTMADKADELNQAVRQ